MNTILDSLERVNARRSTLRNNFLTDTTIDNSIDNSVDNSVDNSIDYSVDNSVDNSLYIIALLNLMFIKKTTNYLSNYLLYHNQSRFKFLIEVI